MPVSLDFLVITELQKLSSWLCSVVSIFNFEHIWHTVLLFPLFTSEKWILTGILNLAQVRVLNSNMVWTPEEMNTFMRKKTEKNLSQNNTMTKNPKAPSIIFFIGSFNHDVHPMDKSNFTKLYYSEHLPQRRHSLEDEMLYCPPYSINSMTMQNRNAPTSNLKSVRRRELSSAPVRKLHQKSNTNSKSKPKQGKLFPITT